MPRIVIGCDLSRTVLDIHSLPNAASTQVANDQEEIAAWVSSLAPDVLIVFEATSGGDGSLIAALAERGTARSGRINDICERADTTYVLVATALPTNDGANLFPTPRLDVSAP